MKTILLIGLGRIGWRGFGDANIETHASTIIRHPNLRLVGIVDINPEVRLNFQETYGTLAYSTIDTALVGGTPDIAVVATPPETHRPMVERLAASGIRGILCEKPLATTVADARAIDAVCRSNGTVLVVGHQRRYESRHLLMRAFLNSHAIGEPVSASAQFSGGYLNNGTHAADVCRMMVGDDIPKRIYYTEEQRFSVTVACGRGAVTLSSYGNLASGYMRTMYDNLIESIDGHEQPICDGQDGVEAVRLALDAEEVDAVA